MYYDQRRIKKIRKINWSNFNWKKFNCMKKNLKSLKFYLSNGKYLILWYQLTVLQYMDNKILFRNNLNRNWNCKKRNSKMRKKIWKKKKTNLKNKFKKYRYLYLCHYCIMVVEIGGWVWYNFFDSQMAISILYTHIAYY